MEPELAEGDILIQDQRYQDSEIKIQKSRSRNQDSELKIQKSRFRVFNVFKIFNATQFFLDNLGPNIL